MVTASQDSDGEARRMWIGLSVAVLAGLALTWGIVEAQARADRQAIVRGRAESAVAVAQSTADHARLAVEEVRAALIRQGQALEVAQADVRRLRRDREILCATLTRLRRDSSVWPPVVCP